MRLWKSVNRTFRNTLNFPELFFCIELNMDQRSQVPDYHAFRSGIREKQNRSICSLHSVIYKDLAIWAGILPF